MNEIELILWFLWIESVVFLVSLVLMLFFAVWIDEKFPSPWRPRPLRPPPTELDEESKRRYAAFAALENPTIDDLKQLVARETQ